MPNWLDKNRLCRKTCMSMSTIDRLEKEGNFPPRFVSVSRKVVWDEEEVDKWMEGIKALSRAQGIKPSTKPDVRLTKKWQEANDRPPVK